MANDPTAFTNTLQGRGYDPGEDLAVEGLNGGQNSQTQFMRSIQGMIGTQGKQVLDSGKATTQTAEDGLGDLDSLLAQLTGGDRSAAEAAIQPQVDNISQQYGLIRNMISETGARGGGRTSQLSQLPFEKVKAVTGLIGGARNAAMSTRAGLLSTLLQSGLQKTSQGIQGLNAASSANLTARGQDISEVGRNMNFATQLTGLLI